MKNLFRNPFKKESPKIVTVPLTPAQMMNRANSIVDNALGMFTQAVKDVDKANAIQLEAIVISRDFSKQLKDEALKHDTQAELGEATVKANLALKEKLSQFTKV